MQNSNLKICSKSFDGRHNFASTGLPCINGCGVDQFQLKYGYKKEDIAQPSLLDGYIERLLARKPIPGRNYCEQVAIPYLKSIKWVNETFESDIKLFWIATNRYWKTHLPAEYIKLMDWVRSKDNLHPKAVAKLLNKKSTLPPWAGKSYPQFRA